MTAVRPARHHLRRHLSALRRRLPAAVLGLAATLAQAQATDAPALPDSRACATLWQVSPVPDGVSGETAQLRVALRFQAGARNQTALHLPGGWAALAETGTPRLRPVAGEAAWRSVAHAPGETVQLQWRLQPAADGAAGAALLAPGWFAFSGQAVLPMPEGADAPEAGPACVLLQGGPADSRWASSHGSAEGASALWRLGAAGVPLAQRVQQSLYAGGALQVQAVPGLLAVLPRPSPWPIDAGTLAEAGARALAAQQRQWGPAGASAHATAPTAASAHVSQDAGTTPPWLLLALPAPAADTTLAGAWHQALALQLPPGWAGDGAALQRLLAPALARAWLADRFGPLAHAGRGDGALRAWFSDGWADFLAHRALLRDGLWSPDEFAAAMTARAAAYLADPARALPNADLAAGSAQSPALAQLQAMRGEWLALTWHQALRRAGQPGLDAALRLQLVPPAQARREGPLSMPLATHRVLATLRNVLQDQPLRDLQQHIDQGRPFELGPDSLGPCFTAGATAPGTAPAWRPVPGAPQQADCQGWLGLGPRLDMQLGRVPRLAPVAGLGGGQGDCELVPVRGKRAKASKASKAGRTGKAVQAGVRQVLRCRPADAAAAGSPTVSKAGGWMVAKTTAMTKGKAKAKAKAPARAAGKSSDKSTAKAAKPRAAKRTR